MEHDTAAYRGVQAGVLFFRLMQVAAVLLAITLPVGSLLANQNVIAFIAIGVISLLLLVFVLVVQVMISTVKERVAPES